ncbi:phasin family protein [Geothrix sp. 21YS21S-2]|uniref:phasin family protein n=1 Tax=Geothrix sp. 21YS21S-2 TaxID=3068893 RepID=UPI0027BA3E54|nr:phasin family protein [Geothrix sp. 21YS21S-2]
MVTRKKAQAPTGLKGTANDIWLAGLGAFNLAGEEGGRIFKALVKRGREQKKTNAEWMAGLQERTDGLKEDAKGLLERVAAPIEDGLAAAMQRLGVPTRSEIINLTHRVEALTRNVSKAAPKAAPKPKPKAKARPKAKAQAPTA